MLETRNNVKTESIKSHSSAKHTLEESCCWMMNVVCDVVRVCYEIFFLAISILWAAAAAQQKQLLCLLILLFC